MAIIHNQVDVYDSAEITDSSGVGGPSVFNSLNTLNAAIGGSVFLDSAFRVENLADPTKEVAISAAAISTGTTRTLTMANRNLSLSTPVFDSISTTGTSGRTVTLDGSILEMQSPAVWRAISQPQFNLTTTPVSLGSWERPGVYMVFFITPDGDSGSMLVTVGLNVGAAFTHIHGLESNLTVLKTAGTTFTVTVGGYSPGYILVVNGGTNAVTVRTISGTATGLSRISWSYFRP
jgi:hypothetical protein